jgi:hypothetical protein
MTESQSDAQMLAAVALVRCLRSNGDWTPIVSRLDPADVRGTLSLVAEFDSDLLIRLAEELLLEFGGTPG